MSVALFGRVAAFLPEPVLLVAADTRVLAANPAAHRLVARLEEGLPLSEFVAEDADRTASLVRRWLRTGHPVPAGLTLNGRDGDRIRSRCFGARATWMPDDSPAVHLRATRLDNGDRLVSLTGQVNGLQREKALYHRAHRVERELTAAVEAAERSLDRALEFGRDLAEADSAARVAEVVAETVPGVLRCAEAFLDVGGGDLPPGEDGEVVRTPVRCRDTVLGDLVTLGTRETGRHDDVATQVAHALARVASLT